MTEHRSRVQEGWVRRGRRIAGANCPLATDERAPRTRSLLVGELLPQMRGFQEAALEQTPAHGLDLALSGPGARFPGARPRLDSARWDDMARQAFQA